ncbi:hypothetical protein PP175_25255 (plasmid) [Aneurinibacillus sp. Ricciae_BoGa-3]|uniref:hypothetical protein n=1 Tax=Aneurinibacillus sp. Ricciae_BoGa-3 TaxID=3022697 RepID=UPI0023407810|nr:hypothetical protein [Aneurinibacillus sp. Ricciae_BoGa-3]WCK57377.1 hypothetical protein PP175_25255 [Aneurinibacillus sp. Ricciae_BoGa-3]
MVEPGQLAQIVVTTPPSVKAGGTVTVSGVGEDKYGNPVAYGTQIKVTSQQGTVSNVTPTTNGNFTFTFQAPTKLKQATGVTESIPITLTSATGDVTQTTQINVNPDVVQNVTINPATNAKTGTAIQITGTVNDKYGNAVADGTSVTILNGGTSIATTATTKGAFSTSYTPTTSGTLALSASAGGVASPSVSDPVASNVTGLQFFIHQSPWVMFGNSWKGDSFLPQITPVGDLKFQYAESAYSFSFMTGRAYLDISDFYGHTYEMMVPNSFSGQFFTVSKATLQKAGLKNIYSFTSWRANSGITGFVVNYVTIQL